MGSMGESRRLVVEALMDRSIVLETLEHGDLRFEYRSASMRASIDETKHGEPYMTIESAKSPSPERTPCWARVIIMPWWQDSWSDDELAEFGAMIGSTLEALA